VAVFFWKFLFLSFLSYVWGPESLAKITKIQVFVMLKYLAWMKLLQTLRIVFMTWGGEEQDVVNAAAWLIFSREKADGHSWLSLLQPCRQQFVHNCEFFSVGQQPELGVEAQAVACGLPSC